MLFYNRLVRDSNTGIGRGIGYVNFTDKDSVETALKLNGTQVELRTLTYFWSVPDIVQNQISGSY